MTGCRVLGSRLRQPAPKSICCSIASAGAERKRGGKEGAFRPLSARKEAERLYALVKQGKDIAGDAREFKRVAVELAFSPFVDEFCETTLKAKWPKSWKMTRDCLRLHASRHWGNKPLPDIAAADVRNVLRRLDDRPATKRNLFAALSFLFNQSKREGLIATSPLDTVEPPRPVVERTRVLNDEELRWLWGALQGEPQPYRGIVEDLIFLGQRRGEVAGLTWSELNREGREWHLQAARAKNGCDNIIPLTDRAIVKIDALAGAEKWPRSGLVYPSGAGTVPSGWSKLKRRLDASIAVAAKAAGAEVAPWKLHDLRRTLATRLQRLGVPHEVVEHLLNHREKSRTGIAKVYQTYSYDAEKRSALQRWEAELNRLLSGAGAVIVPFARPT